MRYPSMLEPRTFRKKPNVVDALQFTGPDMIDDVEAFVDFNFRLEADADQTLKLWNNLEASWIRCPIGHWILKGIRGEFYPCDPDVFAETYEEEPSIGYL